MRSSDARFPTNRHFFVPIKDLQRAPSQPNLTITPVNDHELHVALQATRYAFFVSLQVLHEATRFSDNYFDLLPGEQRAVVITNTDIVLTPEMLAIG